MVRCLILQGNKAAFSYCPWVLLLLWIKECAVNRLHQMWYFDTATRGNEGVEETKNKTLNPVCTVNTNREWSSLYDSCFCFAFFNFIDEQPFFLAWTSTLVCTTWGKAWSSIKQSDETQKNSSANQHCPHWLFPPDWSGFCGRLSMTCHLACQRQSY